RPPLKGEADAGPGPLLLPSRLGGDRRGPSAGNALDPRHPHPDRPQGDGRLVSGPGLAALIFLPNRRLGRGTTKLGGGGVEGEAASVTPPPRFSGSPSPSVRWR